MKKYNFLFLSLLISTAYSQSLDNLNKLVQGSKKDANYLLTGYARPFLEVFPYGLNQGWYSTARPHHFGGFDISAFGSLILVPNTDLTYTVDNSQLEEIVHVKADGTTPSTDPVPTLFGAQTAPRYNYKSPIGLSGATAFDGPSGFDLKKRLDVQALAVPIFNLGIGLPGGLEVKGRFVPKMPIGIATISLWGAGAMYDIKQHFPAPDDIPFDLSVFAAYTTLNSTAVIDAKKNQQAEFAASGATLQALISRKMSFLTIYGGLGYNKGWSSLKVKGTYDVGRGFTITDPLDLSIANSGPRVTAGARFKLAILVLSIDYTLQKYSAVTVGIGFDFGGGKNLDSEGAVLK